MRILQASEEAFLVGFCGMAMGQQGDESRRSYGMLRLATCLGGCQPAMSIYHIGKGGWLLSGLGFRSGFDLFRL